VCVGTAVGQIVQHQSRIDLCTEKEKMKRSGTEEEWKIVRVRPRLSLCSPPASFSPLTESLRNRRDAIRTESAFRVDVDDFAVASTEIVGQLSRDAQSVSQPAKANQRASERASKSEPANPTNRLRTQQCNDIARLLQLQLGALACVSGV
jgi:hypothetical protein